MTTNGKNFLEQTEAGLPFPLKWVQTDPHAVEAILEKMSLPEQARCVMQAEGRQKQDLLLLSPRAAELVRSLPPEEVYYMVKEIGETDSLPVLSVVSQEQLQYIFDVEWWRGDQFLPERAADWLELLEKCGDDKILDWLMGEEMDQRVMMLQSLIKVFKDDEMTDSYAGVEGLASFSPDGVYDIFFKIADVAPALSKFLTILRGEHEEEFFALMEAVIWYPVSSTVERAYRWRLTRTSERGILGFEEAYEVYSRLDPEVLNVDVASPEAFSRGGAYEIAPHYLTAQGNASTFLKRCLAQMRNQTRLGSIRWELVYLANKVMVADRCDSSELADQQEVMRKVLGFVNIGLELGGGEDMDKGIKLLEQTWMQSLFQVGYGRLMKLKWNARKLFQDNGPFLDRLLDDGQRDCVSSLMVHRVPVFREEAGENNEDILARNFESMKEIETMEKFLRRLKFYCRFARQSLNLNLPALNKIATQCAFPKQPERVTLLHLVSTALANFSLFQEVSCAPPLPAIAARAFLELIFLPRAFEEEPRICDADRVDAFRRKAMESSMAWTDADKALWDELIAQCVQNLEDQFGRIDFKADIEWEFVNALCIQLPA